MTVSKAPPNDHVVAFAFQFWGHTKPLCALLTRIVRLRRTCATLFVALPLFDKASNEVSRQFLPQGEEHLKELIRIVGYECASAPMDTELSTSNFLEGYKTLLASKPIHSKPNCEIVYDALSPPQLVVMDFFAYYALKGVKSLSGSSVPIYAWQSAAATATLFIFGPEKLGGAGDLAAKLENIKVKDGQSLNDAAEDIYRRVSGEIVHVPGLPPMYDYEHSAQSPIFDVSIAFFCANVYNFFLECDGVIHCSTPLYESGALEAWKEWFGERPVVAVGPLSPPIDAAAIEKEKANSPIAIDVERFLNKALEAHGGDSVIYISFGTVWWTKEPEKIWAILDVLMELNIPFLLSHASPAAVIPDEVRSKIEASGLGFLAKWLPQQMILRHAACGWFLSHCGHNSTMESLTEGVPLICWPFDADQPANAANVTDILDAGYELFEVRTGHGLRPVLRLGDRAPEGTIEAVRREAIEVFTKARGEDGRRKRANAERLSEAIAKSWEHGGLCWDELRKVTDVLQ